MSEDWNWFACCLITEDPYPFGFCRSCWIAAGKPQPMGGFTDEQE